MTAQTGWKVCYITAAGNTLWAAFDMNVHAVLGWFTVTLFAWRELVMAEEEK